MKVIMTLLNAETDENEIKVFDYPGLKRYPSIVRAFNEIKIETKYYVQKIKTERT